MSRKVRSRRLGLLLSLTLLAATAEYGMADSPLRGGTFTVANRGDPPAGFDPMRTSSIALHHVAGALFGSGNLVTRCRENMYFVCPYLASSWFANQSFTEWTFTIRDGVHWHDSSPFTAEDAAFWFELVFFGAGKDGNRRAPAYFAHELGRIDSVDLLEFNRVRVRFKDRNPHFLDILANPRFKIAHPKHLMEPQIERGNVSVSPMEVGLIGVGPFKLGRYRPGSLIRLIRNDSHWERDAERLPLPYLDGVDFVIMRDSYAMDIAFRSGRLDATARGQGHYLTTERLDAYRVDMGEEVQFARIEGGTFRLAFNVLRAGPWQDPDVRRAIALWIDKRSAIPVALGGFGWTAPDLGPADIPVPRHFVNWPKFDTAPLSERREEARRLIERAGYGEGFSMGHLTRALNTAPAEYLKSQLLGLGIELKLQIVDEGEWNRARVSLDYDTQQGRLTPSPIPEGTESAYGRFSENPDAYAKHEDPYVDALYRRLGGATTLAQRVAIWRDIERYLFVELTYSIPIAESINVVAYRRDVRGLVIPTEDAHTHTDFATVWIDG